MSEMKWQEFLKSGSVNAYLEYINFKNISRKDESENENSNSGTNNKRNQYR
jgi:hypothetical protein